MKRILQICILTLLTHKDIKKRAKISYILLIITVLLSAFGATILKNQIAQQKIVSIVLQQLKQRKDIEATISSVNIDIWSNSEITDLLIKDLCGDTIIHCSNLKIISPKINFQENSISIENIELTRLQTSIRRGEMSPTNVQDLLNILISGSTQWTTSVEKVTLIDSEINYFDKYRVSNLDITINTDSISSHHFYLKGKGFTFNDSVVISNVETKIGYDSINYYIPKLAFNFDNSSINIEDSYFSIDSTNSINGEFKISNLEFDPKRSNLPKKILDKTVPFNGKATLALDGNKLTIKSIKSEYDKDNSIFIAGQIDNIYDIKNSSVRLMVESNWDSYSSISPTLLLDRFISDEELNRYNYIDGEFSFKSIVIGSLSKVSIETKISSSDGELDLDLELDKQVDNNYKFTSKITTDNFSINRGELDISNIYSHLDLKGIFKNSSHYYAVIEGGIDSIAISDNNISNIYLNIEANPVKYTGDIFIEDPNIRLSYNGNLNIAKDHLDLEFRSSITNINLHKLSSNKINVQKISGQITSQLKIFDDGVNGTTQISELSTKIGKKQERIKKIVINSNSSKGGFKRFNINSNLLNIELTGKFEYSRLAEYFQDALSYAIPTFSQKAKRDENFRYSIVLNRSTEFTKFILPNLSLNTPCKVEGYIDSSQKRAELKLLCSKFITPTIKLDNLNITTEVDSNKVNSTISADHLNILNNYSISNSKVVSRIEDNIFNSNISWDNRDTKYSGAIETEGVLHNSGKVSIDILPSKINIDNQIWNIEPSKIDFQNREINLQNIKLSHNSQSIIANGQLSNNPTDLFTLTFKDLNLDQLRPLSSSTDEMEGVINGDISIYKQNNMALLETDLTIKDFIYSERNLGDLYLINRWQGEDKILKSNLLLVQNNINRASISGTVDPYNNHLDFTADITKLPFETLSPFLSSFSEYQAGVMDGKIALAGAIDNPKWDGKVKLSDGVLKISETNVDYSIDGDVLFTGDSIIFNSMDIKDRFSNQGVFNGYIKHNLFSDLFYDMELSSNKIEVLNTGQLDNSEYYGKAVGNGGIKIVTNRGQLDLIASLSTLGGTNITLPLSTPESARRSNFIRFSTPKLLEDTLVTEENPFASIDNSKDDDDLKTNFFLNIRATEDAIINILFDNENGDKLTGTGSGDLRIIYDPTSNLSMHGDFTTVNTTYTFSLKNYLFSKKFNVKPGGTMIWTGDPYEAQIDMEAVYSTRASLSNLMPESNEVDYSNRMNVDCIIKLAGELQKPEVKFDISLPTAEERTKEEAMQYMSSDDELTKQMLSLLITGQFITPDYLTNSSSSNNLVGATASEMLSNQLSGILTELTTAVDIGFSYRPGDQASNDQIEVDLSTKLFDNRMTINGNVGNSSTVSSNNQSSFVGEVEIFYKVNKSGDLQLKAYNRSNDDLLYNTGPYTQGVGVIYSKSFKNIKDIIRRYREQKKN